MTTIDRLAVPGPSPEVEARRRKELRQYKAFATGLLVFAAVVFLGCRWYETQVDPSATWVGFVRAAAEAGMIGGLADWFAVTALFRYPLGLKIPHTAIIRRKKDQVGEALSGFVGDNFLNAELITEKVSKAQVPERIAQWLVQPENAETVSREVGKFTANAVNALDPKDAEAVIRSSLIDKLAQPEWGPPLGRTLGKLVDGGQVEPLVDQFLGWVHKKALDSEDIIVRILDERAPSWAPKFVNELVGDRVYRELITWTAAVNADKNHEARAAIRRFINQFVEDLQNDPAMIARVEEIKADVMNSEPVKDAAGMLWQLARDNVVTAAVDPDSALRRKIVELAVTWGTKLQEDPQLRQSLDRRITGAAAFLADNYAAEVTGIISETIERWDADEASDKIELMVGKDLQYIRLNGTIVGALAGLAIYSVSYLLFG
ncbi:putative membrane protein [Corynebacterium mustelae]|uniref:Putative membrane protein n=1 Tax=Corynebacterium mustelae TaxID=571915 RepID=A0A0G3GVW5_9CORY|nr:DUF445 family protein [Corynebacterium mustelae]AKK04645.1 putative membrane protein [Corynebacterium mustelae]